MDNTHIFGRSDKKKLSQRLLRFLHSICRRWTQQEQNAKPDEEYNRFKLSTAENILLNEYDAGYRYLFKLKLLSN